jgi:hypothetical protein
VRSGGRGGVEPPTARNVETGRGRRLPRLRGSTPTEDLRDQVGARGISPERSTSDSVDSRSVIPTVGSLRSSRTDARSCFDGSAVGLSPRTREPQHTICLPDRSCGGSPYRRRPPTPPSVSPGRGRRWDPGGQPVAADTLPPVGVAARDGGGVVGVMLPMRLLGVMRTECPDTLGRVGHAARPSLPG